MFPMLGSHGSKPRPRISRSCRLVSAVGLLLSLWGTSCQTATETKAIGTVTISTPEVWASAQKGKQAKISTGWLKEFKSPRMNELVNEALKNNHNLNATAYRLRATRENIITSKANQLPSVSASTGYSRSDSEQRATSENYSLSFRAEWEADLWGRLRNRELAARADYASALADYRGARLSLAANTARAWCNLVTAERQLALADTTVASYKRALPVVERRYLSGTLRAVDVRFARDNVASAERTLRIRRNNRDQAARTLELLLGRYPSATVGSTTELPTLSKSVPAGLPAELLERRPDLAAARAALYSSAQRAEAQRKNLLPSVRLTGGASNGAESFSRIFDPNYLTYSIASSLAQTIYRGGALKADARAALARNYAEVHDYTRIALNAFREVEAALGSEDSLREQEIFLTQEVKQSTQAEIRAIEGIAQALPGSSFLEYLEAQRRAESARASLIRLRNSRLLNRIDLHLALGGDFSTSQP